MAIRITGAPFTAWEVTEAAESTGVFCSVLTSWELVATSEAAFVSVTADDGFSVLVGTWDVAEYVIGVLWLIAVLCESVVILEKVLCIEPSFNPAVELAAGVDACTFDETWVLAVKAGLAAGVDACMFDEIWALAEFVKGTGVV